MDELDKSFSFFVPLELQKSAEDPEAWVVGGVISTKDKDFDGEKVVQKGLDFDTYFKSNGFIKYEHKSDTPSNIVGVPEDPVVAENETHIRGTLLKSVPMAKEVHNLAQALEQHNVKRPDNPRRLGWSIEGKYVNRQPDGSVEKALVTNVVITPNPKNTGTYLELCKSLTAGYGTSPETQTDGGALRKESLEGGPKQEVEGKDDKKKKKFKSYDDAYAHYIGEGLSHEEATKKAKQQFKEGAKKAMSDLKEIEERVEKLEALPGKIDELGELITKSFAGLDRGNPSGLDVLGNETPLVDATEFMKNLSSKLEDLNKGLKSTQEGNDAGFKLVAKALGTVGDQMSAVAEVQQGQGKEIADLKKSLDETDKLVKAMAGADTGVSTIDLGSEQVAGEGSEDVRLEKSQAVSILTDMALKEGSGVDVDTVTICEMTGFIPDNLKKSVVEQAKQKGLIS